MAYKIEEVAQQTKLTKRALRYYEELGLIKPSARTEGGYRLYTDDDIRIILNIKTTRELLGFSLAEIKDYIVLEQKTDALRTGYYANESVKEQIDLLNELEQTLSNQRNLLTQKISKMNEVLNSYEVRLDKIVKKKKQLMESVNECCT